MANFWAAQKKEKQHPKKTSKITKIRPKSSQGPILGAFWEPFGLPFRTFSVMISATTRFSKIYTAPTQEHDFRASGLPKITHFGTLFPLIFRTLSGPPPEHHFGASCADLVPKSSILGPPLDPTGPQNGTQNGPRAPKIRAQKFPRAPQERPRS